MQKTFDHLKNKGELLESKVNEAINQNNLKDIISLSGHPTWKFINWHATEEYSQAELKTAYEGLSAEQKNALDIAAKTIAVTESK